jgi:hypothetical protein
MAKVMTSYSPASGAAGFSRFKDTLIYDINSRPQAMTFYCRFRDHGTAQTGQGRWLFSWGSTGATGPRVLVDAVNGKYRSAYTYGPTGSLTATPNATPVYGQIVESRTALTAAGALIAGVTVNGGTEATSTSSAIVLPEAWNSMKLVLSGHAQLSGFSAWLDFVVNRGVQNLTTMRRLAGVT